MEEYPCDGFTQVDSTKFGDVLGSIWQVGLIGLVRMKSLTNMEHTPYAKTVGDRYTECGMTAVRDERGIISHCAMQFSSAQEVVITDQRRHRRLSVKSGVGMWSFLEVMKYEEKWPMVVSTDGDSREVSWGDMCVVLGNKSWWEDVVAPEKQPLIQSGCHRL